MNLPYISRLPSVACLMTSILLVPGVMAGTLDLAVRGRAPEYAIVRAVDASPSVKYAAEELRDFTERMTGVRLPIVEVGEATEGYRVRLDCHSKLPQ